jgi:hypothetical protein
MMDDKEAFNAFTADWKNRIETLIKTVLLLSGGVMSITIGAYINANPPKLPEIAINIIRYSWYLLSGSLVASLLTFFLLVVSGAIVLKKWEKRVSTKIEGLVIIDSPRWLHILCWGLGIIAVVSCLIGVALVAHGATYLLRPMGP